MFVFSESESAQKVGVRNKESELGSRTPKTKGECEKQGKVWQLDKESFQDNKKRRKQPMWMWWQNEILLIYCVFHFDQFTLCHDATTWKRNARAKELKERKMSWNKMSLLATKEKNTKRKEIESNKPKE